MKKILLSTLILATFLISIVFISAPINAAITPKCVLDISLINQDPYPAIPGEYAKIVFQINGVSNPECKEVEFELLDKFPISFDPGKDKRYTINSGIYAKDYSSFFLAPYEVRIDKDAIKGDTPIEVQYKYSNNQVYETKQFTINIEDTRTNFEVYIKDYDPQTNILTFEILNIGESDVEALTIEIPKQDSIKITGSSTNIVGDLDSNEYTTADFKANPTDNEIKINIFYTDAINKRRQISKSVEFDSTYYPNEKKGTSFVTYLIYIIIILLIAWFIFKKITKNKRKKTNLNKL